MDTSWGECSSAEDGARGAARRLALEPSTYNEYERIARHRITPHLDAATMSVAGRRTRVGYEMVDRAGAKTAAGARVVDLDPTTVVVMSKLRDDQAAAREAWGEAYVETGYVFTAENGEPTHADYVAQRFARLVAAAGVPSIRFHDLRHTHATLVDGPDEA